MPRFDCSGGHRLLVCSEDGNVVIDLRFVLLSNAFGDPHNVTALLFLELKVGVEDPKVELLHECVDIEAHFVLEELVLQSLVFMLSLTLAFEQHLIFCIILGHSADLFIVIGARQSGQPIGK